MRGNQVSGKTIPDPGCCVQKIEALERTKTGILLVNLGTPDSPKTGDVRKYLKQFLLDARVIDIPTIPRNLLVRGIIAPFRAPKSAATYQEIWTKEGSPLLVISEQLKDLVQEKLGNDYQVELAMRYQSPSVEEVLSKFKGQALKQLKVIPLFPQYASATSGSVHQEVMRILSDWQIIPDVQFVNSYHDHPQMIEAFAERGRQYNLEEYDHFLFSYHGLPIRQLTKADEHNHCQQSPDCCKVLSGKNFYCYSAQCYDTTYKIAEALDLPKDKYTVCFQSRLGKTPWLQPYTSEVIEKLAKEKSAKKVLVFCPAFTADCLETIFEIGVEYKEEFEEHGGEHLQLVEGLNTHPKWVEAVAALCQG